MHQRAWALEQDVDRIEWTFDPLVRRNARLNLVKLGGVASAYHVNFYGAMPDGINEGDASDRFILQWDLASDRVAAAMAGELEAPTRESLLAIGAEIAVDASQSGEPVSYAATAPVRLIALPEDILAMRGTDKALSLRWREAVRDAVAPVVSAGGRVVSLTVEGDYVMEVGA